MSWGRPLREGVLVRIFRLRFWLGVGGVVTGLGALTFRITLFVGFGVPLAVASFCRFGRSGLATTLGYLGVAVVG